MRRRRGYALVELLVVLSVNSALMVVAVALLAGMLKSDRTGRRHFERARAMTSLARQFRADVAAARQATIATTKTGDTLTLRLPNNRTVEYAPEGDRLRRAARVGDTVSHREAYALSELSGVKFATSDDRLATLTLTFGGDSCRVDARLASDHRFVGAEERP